MDVERDSTRYWCHECNRVVDPIVEVESVKCSLCHGGFVEDMESIRSDHHPPHDGDPDSDRALSLWAPILLGMMSNPRRRFRQLEFDDENEDVRRDPEERYHRHREGGESELDSELESIMRRRRGSATILQLLQGIRAGMVSESENDRENGGENNRERERVFLINPFNQTIIVHGGGGGGGGGGGAGNPFDSSNPHPIGSLGDYFVGPGLELLIQHLAENDPNRHGTPPAKKEAVEAMPTVTIDESSIQCSVCLEDFEVGTEAKQMPCKHRFHSSCILPWLELHSSCPVCRYQLPADESKLDQERDGPNGSTGSMGNTNGGSGNEGEDGDGRRFSVSLPWPLSSFFSSSLGSSTGSLTTSSSSASGVADRGRGSNEGSWREENE